MSTSIWPGAAGAAGRHMRFAIMQHTPGYQRADADAEEAITGQEGTLLRLLVLRRGRPLSKEEIARQLTRTGKHTVLASSVPGYVARLRGRIGQEYIRSTAGYSSAIDHTEVDAFVFENLIRQHGVCDVADIDDVDSDMGDLYEQLLDLHAMWHANPALQFADDHDDEFVTAVYHEFEHYWDCLKRCIIYCELRSRRKPRIERAIGRVKRLLELDPSDEQLWALLYRAQASLPAHDGPATATYDLIQQQFPRGTPAALDYTIRRINHGHKDSLFEIDQHPRRPDTQRPAEGRALSGNWYSHYVVFPEKGTSSSAEEQKYTILEIQLSQAGSEVAGTGTGKSENYFISATIQESYLTGTWQNAIDERHSWGAFQLARHDNSRWMIGKFVGKDSDSHINHGIWLWARKKEELYAAARWADKKGYIPDNIQLNAWLNAALGHPNSGEPQDIEPDELSPVEFGDAVLIEIPCFLIAGTRHNLCRLIGRH